MNSAHHLSPTDVLAHLHTTAEGLSLTEVKKRQAQFGLNTLPQAKRLKLIQLFFSQFANAMALLMGIATLLSLLFDHLFDAALILSMVLVNAIMGFIQEYRAEKSVAALKQLLSTKVLVKRDGRTTEVTQEDVTVGDVIQLQEGDKVPADAYLLQSHNLYVSESVLTGESVPTPKMTGTLPEKTGLAERSNCVWMGTTITQGTAEAVVTAIGLETEFGRIAHTLRNVSSEKEHFSQKISVLSKQMGAVAILSAMATFLVGFFIRGFTLEAMSIYTIATLVSALPEGLPIILVIVLAIGAQRMAKKNAIVRKLSATETLGVVSVIITDKTGTLTQNTMSANKVYLPGQPLIDVKTQPTKDSHLFYQDSEPLLLHENEPLRKLIIIAGVCHHIKISNQSQITFNTIYGDPTEKALFLLAHQAGFHQLEKHDLPTTIDNLPFQQQWRMRGCLVSTKDQREFFVLGAPENVLERCDHVLQHNQTQHLSLKFKKEIEDHMAELSQQGLRVVAFASFPGKEGETLASDDLDTKGGTFIGLVGLYDPPRPEVKAALEKAQTAGIRIVMATGDHPETALAIAKEIGLVAPDYSRSQVVTQTDLEGLGTDDLRTKLLHTNVLARLTPEMKLKVAELYQSQGHVVAMTGDGVNDAPALKKADVGIAMGITGTEVAREASKIVLTDDNFASIVAAIKEGRTQFSNLRRASFFLIMTNIAESAALLLALALGYPLPLLPIQILWLNVITGGLTDFALSMEPSHEETMQQPPRSPDENILNLRVLPLIGSITIMTTVLCLAVFHFFLPIGEAKARTALFVMLSFSQLLNMFNLRSLNRSAFQLGFFSNRAVTVVFGVSLILLASALWITPLQQALRFASLTIWELSALALLSLLIFITAEVTKYLFRNRPVTN